MKLLIPSLIIILLSCFNLEVISSLSSQGKNQIKVWGNNLEGVIRHKRSTHGHGVHIEKCDRENQKMIVRGVNVSLSKLLNEENKLWCRHAQTLEIFALDSIIIDDDLKPESEDFAMIMFSRKWIIEGKRTLDLSGQKGKPVVEERAIDLYPNGMNGVPGNPGKNGGSFMGFYEEVLPLTNDSVLVINVSGGEGGNGQDGGNGMAGQSGEDAKYEDFPSPYSELDSKMERLRHLEFNLLYGYRYKNYILHGTWGTVGGNGGNGGVGGIGGNPGFVEVMESNRTVGGSDFIKILRDVGVKGEDGKGGRGGQGGRHGDGYQCTWRGVLIDAIRWWDKCHYVPKSKIARELWAKSGTPGRNGGNDAGLVAPRAVNTRFDEFSEAKINVERFFSANRWI